MAFLGHVQKKNFKVKKCKICTQLSSEAARVYTVYTSSTPRGGGGSFETTKTIGEIGCCESRMSEQKH